MEAAAYGLIGTAIGAIITVLTGLLNNKHQITVRRLELAEQAQQARWESDRKERAERLARYAGFLSAYWQAERFMSEILDLMDDRTPGWAKNVDGLVDSEPFQAAISNLNEGAAWISLLSADARAEGAAHQASRTFDELVDSIDDVRLKEVPDEPFDLSACRKNLAELQQEIRTLSALLRDDLHAEKAAVSGG
jgi:hypothetical protein